MRAMEDAEVERRMLADQQRKLAKVAALRREAELARSLPSGRGSRPDSSHYYAEGPGLSRSLPSGRSSRPASSRPHSRSNSRAAYLRQQAAAERQPAVMTLHSFVEGSGFSGVITAAIAAALGQSALNEYKETGSTLSLANGAENSVFDSFCALTRPELDAILAQAKLEGLADVLWDRLLIHKLTEGHLLSQAELKHLNSRDRDSGSSTQAQGWGA